MIGDGLIENSRESVYGIIWGFTTHMSGINIHCYSWNKCMAIGIGLVCLHAVEPELSAGLKGRGKSTLLA